jgi:hypothetical protein
MNQELDVINNLLKFSISLLISQITIIIILIIYYLINFYNIYNEIIIKYLFSLNISNILTLPILIYSIYKLKEAYYILKIKYPTLFMKPYIGVLLLLASIYSIISILIFLYLFSIILRIITFSEGLSISLPIILVISIFGLVGELMSYYIGFKNLSIIFKLNNLNFISKIYLISIMISLIPFFYTTILSSILLAIGSYKLYYTLSKSVKH